MRETRQYTDEQREEALATLIANGNRVRFTARSLDIPPETLIPWRDKALRTRPDLVDLGLVKRTQKPPIGSGGLFERASRRAVRMVEAQLEKLEESGAQLTPSGIEAIAITAGIMADKAMDTGVLAAPGRKSNGLTIDQSQHLELPAGTTLADLKAMAAQLAPPQIAPAQQITARE